MADQLIPYREGMDYRVGLDTPSADARNTAVKGNPTSIPNATSSIVQFKAVDENGGKYGVVLSRPWTGPVPGWVTAQTG
jgi:hypothetical protein